MMESLWRSLRESGPFWSGSSNQLQGTRVYRVEKIIILSAVLSPVATVSVIFIPEMLALIVGTGKVFRLAASFASATLGIVLVVLLLRPSTQSTLDLKDINDGASSGHPGQ